MVAFYTWRWRRLSSSEQFLAYLQSNDGWWVLGCIGGFQQHLWRGGLKSQRSVCNHENIGEAAESSTTKTNGRRTESEKKGHHPAPVPAHVRTSHPSPRTKNPGHNPIVDRENDRRSVVEK
jgi:hypothetical protein